MKLSNNPFAVTMGSDIEFLTLVYGNNIIIVARFQTRSMSPVRAHSLRVEDQMDMNPTPAVRTSDPPFRACRNSVETVTHAADPEGVPHRDRLSAGSQ